MFRIIQLSYIRVLKGMKLSVSAKMRIDYRRVFLFASFLYPGYTVLIIQQYGVSYIEKIIHKNS